METASFHQLLAPSENHTLSEVQESLAQAYQVLRAQPPGQVSWLLDGIAKDPSLSLGLRQRVDLLLAQSNALRLFVQTGLPSEEGFLVNAIDVLSKNLLPTAVRPHDLGDFLAQLFSTEADATWLESLPAETCKQLIDLLSEQRDDRRGTWRKIRSEICDSVEVLALKVASLGLAENIHSHAGKDSIQLSPFHQLLGVCQGLLSTLRENAEHDLRLDQCVQLAVECRGTLSRVIKDLETSGVSVAVVHRVDLISRCLNRIITLLKLLKVAHGPQSYSVCVNFVAALVRHRLRDESLLELFRGNLTLLSRRIVESASARGEHYITNNMREFRFMFYSACGGGFITAFTTIFKYRIANLQLPLLMEGLTTASDYALSFVAIQALHFTLATKQPSHTAASLAHALSEDNNPIVTERLVSLVVRICRSQLAAVCGNIVAVVPTALVVHRIVEHFFHTDLIDEHTATHILESLDPFSSLTLFYAALTGVVLWMGSIFAGFAENWAVYRKLPQAIAEHRLGRKIGREKMRRLSVFVQHNVSSLAANVSLGVMLAMIPMLGKFTGLPLDVRHVTLSTGALTFAVERLGYQVMYTPLFWKAVVGIAFIGFLNLIVSFLLALVVAFRARDAQLLTMWQVLREVLREAGRRPLSFVWPVKSIPETPELPAPKNL